VGGRGVKNMKMGRGQTKNQRNEERERGTEKPTGTVRAERKYSESKTNCSKGSGIKKGSWKLQQSFMYPQQGF